MAYEWQLFFCYDLNMLSIPEFLKETNVQTDWDNNNQTVDPKSDPETKTRLEKLSYRAIQAFASGSTEWLVYRFDKTTDTKPAWNFIELAWAMIVHLRYGQGPESWMYYSGKNWQGPKPVQKALELLESTFYTFEVEPSLPASKLVSLAKSVLADSSSYIEWSEKILKRLETFFPYNEEDPLGDVVPREAVDPEFDFQVIQTEELVNNFLSKLDPGVNNFFNSPDVMTEVIEGETEFKGIPFKFDIEQDRNSRLAQI
jgi:hypothetical protein